jgi:hypothetical protein
MPLNAAEAVNKQIDFVQPRSESIDFDRHEAATIVDLGGIERGPQPAAVGPQTGKFGGLIQGLCIHGRMTDGLGDLAGNRLPSFRGLKLCQIKSGATSRARPHFLDHPFAGRGIEHQHPRNSGCAVDRVSPVAHDTCRFRQMECAIPDLNSPG